MSNLKIIVLIASAYFAYEGTWPFYNAVHGDGSVTTAFDYAVHITGVVVMLFIVLRYLFDVVEDVRKDFDDSEERYRRGR